MDRVFVLASFCDERRECPKEHLAALVASFNEKTDQQELYFFELDPHPDKSTTQRSRPKGVAPLNEKLTICDVTLEKVKWNSDETEVNINKGKYNIVASQPLLGKVKNSILNQDSSAENCAKMIKKLKLDKYNVMKNNSRSLVEHVLRKTSESKVFKIDNEFPLDVKALK
mmetsp:Transcript_10585/g.12157  ORF Transcript_10585/g.12157 Transcript_10585/m.12157 type:complete len:170 (-) Transcript_10585:196-705(-)|eukprot:CAMPEP_0184007258 /NCGR_PEP_ID=MMETSP0954-20121128/1212_1 /TAXON_ID=627963 /ORGANISM="Aplanochytrium sp, Strain PBS07" /LENGTH=169 /DNA_ID=CAMNT_0026286025 /DNA_START=382 /DNA_END=891 /DNA_ORIENTATION=-